MVLEHDQVNPQHTAEENPYVCNEECMGETNYRKIIKTYHVKVHRMVRNIAETEQPGKLFFSCILAKAMQIGILYLTDESSAVLNPACEH